MQPRVTTWCHDPEAEQGWYWVLEVDGEHVNGGVAVNEDQAQCEGRWAFQRLEARQYYEVNRYYLRDEEGI